MSDRCDSIREQGSRGVCFQSHERALNTSLDSPHEIAVSGGLINSRGRGTDVRDATFRLTGRPFGASNPTGTGSRKPISLSRTAAMKALGSVVYAARLEDGTIKIGWTEHFENRLRWLANHLGQDVELLGFRSGGYDDEQDIHASLVRHRLDGRREYYHPTSEVMAVVNKMRSGLGLPLIAA